MLRIFFYLFAIASVVWADSGIMGQVRDLHGQAVAGATVRVAAQTVRSSDQGRFELDGLVPGRYFVTAEAVNLRPVTVEIDLQDGVMMEVSLNFAELASVRESIVITSTAIEPTIDRRNDEVFNRTLFTRDDQIFQQLNAGINAGQHEGGGKSLEIRRFGFNMDHGGVNGGLKVLVDDVQQNQGTQGHGQGYLGALKALSPELIQEVTIINGPFSPQYGDFSGLGVIHIRQREALPDEFTARLQGGNFDTGRAFLGWSPVASSVDSYVSYEGSYTDGPFQSPGRYRRDNVNANYTKTLSETQKFGLRFIFGRNDFYSSGQIPLDLVNP